MIDQPVVVPPPEVAESDIPTYLIVLRCSRCSNPLVRVHLTLGSVVQARCHHTIKKPDGKRETCGYVNTLRPSR